MKKVIKFLRSMKFGLILLGLIALISIAGSVIPQGEEAMYYVRNYSSYGLLLRLQLDHVFTSWYFVVLVMLLCINLAMCSILRWRRIDPKKEISAISEGKADVPASREELALIEDTLKKHHCHKTETGGVKVYEKNRFGRYGTFITHLGILLTVIFFALAMYTPVVTDQTCMPKDAITLDDGTQIYVDSFHIEDQSGDLDYRSKIKITLPDGTSSGLKETSVNHPVASGDYKVYQQTYGTIGSVTITDDDGNKDHIYLEDNAFLSRDGHTGIYFNALYPDFKQDGDDFSLITSVTGSYPNPVYTFNLVEYNSEESDDNDLKMTPMLAFPGDDVDAGGLHFHFEKPTEYPGLRIKKSSRIISLLLILSFLIMTIGFVLTFLFQPVLVGIYEDGYHIYGNKPEDVRMMIHIALKNRRE